MLNKEQIMEILPHRPPMLLVDEILEMDENHVVGALHLTGDEFFFQGHFPGNPIMPAVFRLEALAQAGGVALLSLPEFKGKTAVYTGIDKAKFRAMAKPGDTLRLEVTSASTPATSPSPRRTPSRQPRSSARVSATFTSRTSVPT